MHFCEGAAVEWNAREQRRLDQTGIVLHVRLMSRGHEVARLKCHQVDVDGIQCVQACWVKGHDLLHVVRPCNVCEGLEIIGCQLQRPATQNLVNVVEPTRKRHPRWHRAALDRQAPDLHFGRLRAAIWISIVNLRLTEL